MALMGLLMTLLVACTTVRGNDEYQRRNITYTEIDHFGYVMANAFRATHPEYAVTLGEPLWGRRPKEMAIELRIVANWEPESKSGRTAALAIRQDEFSGRIYYSAPEDRTAVPERALLNSLAPRSRQAVELRTTFGSLGQGGTDELVDKGAVDEQLKQAGQTKVITVVVELKEPLTVADVRRKGYLSLNKVIFASAKGEPPVYWDGFTTFCGDCYGDSERITNDFRSWVSALSPSDEDALSHFGLRLERLRETARAGKIAGYLVKEANPGLLRRLLQKDYVRTLHIVRIDEYCADYELGECVPGRWPKENRLEGERLPG
ncbi:hypothetical protein [Nonomuraea sp. NPDC049504]|uniref:hypothetical protein n=1 Tax=Nonomuraea sp. NPDC049504 TaxID=3154729 RepID=UPI0034331727